MRCIQKHKKNKEVKTSGGYVVLIYCIVSAFFLVKILPRKTMTGKYFSSVQKHLGGIWWQKIVCG